MAAPKKRFEIPKSEALDNLFSLMKEDEEFHKSLIAKRKLETPVKPLVLSDADSGSRGSSILSTDDSTIGPLHVEFREQLEINNTASNPPSAEDQRVDEFVRDEQETKQAASAVLGRVWYFPLRVKPKAGKFNPDSVLELSPQMSLPDRVLVAKHIRRSGKTHPPGEKMSTTPSDYTYAYAIYSSVTPLLYHLKSLKLPDRTLFIVIEEIAALFAYFDLEIPLRCIDPRIHGTCALNLFAYCLAVVRAVLSMVLNTNLSCYSRSHLLYDSCDSKKWSAHGHVAWPFKDLVAIRETMTQVAEILLNMYHAGIEAVRPLFYTDSQRKDGKPLQCVIDMSVYTKNRNFRLPNCTKCDRNVPLQLVTAAPEWINCSMTREQNSCAVDIQSPENVLNAGFVLARNSRAFWTRHTVTHPSLLHQASTPHPISSRPQDFRTLPVTGSVTMFRKKLHELLEKPPAKSLTEKQVDELLNSLLAEYYPKEESWSELRDHAAASSPEFRTRTLPKVYEELRKSTRHVAMFAMIWPRFYRPGAGLEQRLMPKILMVDRVATRARQLAEPGTRDYDPFRVMFEMLSDSDYFLSNSCVLHQSNARAAFMRQLYTDFLENFYRPHIEGWSNRVVSFSNIFVLERMVLRLMMCSGVYVHSMQLVKPDEPIPLLHATWLRYPLEKRQHVYKYCFKHSCLDEQYLDYVTFSSGSMERASRMSTVQFRSDCF